MSSVVEKCRVGSGKREERSGKRKREKGREKEGRLRKAEISM